MTEQTARSRSGVGRLLLIGLLSSALTAVASAKPWFTANLDFNALPGVPEADSRIDMPLALALALVVLAGWAAALVSRGRLRGVVAAITLLAQLGVLVCVAAAPFTLPDDLRSRIAGSEDVAVTPTAWFVVTAVAGALAAVALGLALRGLARWPTMSSRYDAPAGASGAAPAPGLAAGVDDLALWKALDDGHDPTAR